MADYNDPRPTATSFGSVPRSGGQVVFDAGLRKHMTIFVDGHALRDRVRLSDPVTPGSVVHICQALSGG